VRYRASGDTKSRARSRELLQAPLFLVSSVRSGSTLLQLMLDHHPEIAFGNEFNYTVTLVSDTGQLPSMQSYLSRVDGVDPQTVDYAVNRSLGYRELVNDFLRQKQATSGGKKYVGATVHRHFDRLRFLWPRARYVHLVRDPRDVARSVLQKGWAGNVYEAAGRWIQAEDWWDSLVTHLSPDQAIELHYEDLVTRTEAELSRICRFIGVEFAPEMLDYQVDAPLFPPPDPTLASQWKKKLSPRDVAMVEHRTARLMESRGYALSGYPLTTIGPLKHQLLLAAARARRLRTRVHSYGPALVAIDLLGRRAELRTLANRAQARINAIDQSVIDQEAAGERAPSANIAPVGRPASGRTAGSGEELKS
jgi:Sulfotransferase family